MSKKKKKHPEPATPAKDSQSASLKRTLDSVKPALSDPENVSATAVDYDAIRAALADNSNSNN